MLNKINVAVFASGTGTNAQKIIDYFKNHAHINITLIVSNKVNAGVLDIAKKEKIHTLLLEKEIYNETGYVEELSKNGIQYIVLAGFLWKIPLALIKMYPNKILNIHPALLPAFGGKGMYGKAVHEAVINGNSKQSGITIHFVDEIYDHGKIIFQARCNVESGETPDSLATKIHVLEHAHYAAEIEKIILEEKEIRNTK